jgi:predicted PurR-regulated permease PerM
MSAPPGRIPHAREAVPPRRPEQTGSPRKEARRNGDADSPAVQMPVGIRSLSLGVIAVFVSIYMVRAMREVLIPVALSILVFHLLAPFVERLTKWRVPRALAATIVMVTALGATGYTAWALRDEAVAVFNELPAAARSFREVIRNAEGQPDSSLKQVKEAASQLENTAKEAVGTEPVQGGVTRVQIVEPVVSISDMVVSGTRSLFIAGGSLILVLVFSFFLLLSADRLKRLTVQVAGPTLTKKKVTVQILDEISRQIQRFLLIQLLTSIIVGATTALALWWLGLRYPIVWGIAAGVLNSVPYVGPLFVTGALTAVAVLQFGTLSMALWVGGVTLAITTAEGYLLTPILQGRVAQMNQVAIFLGILFWSWMWGPVGLLLAVPLMMIVKAVCDHIEELQGMGKLMGE